MAFHFFWEIDFFVIFVRLSAMNIYLYIYNIAVLIIICHFESTLLLKYANLCQNWTFQRFARAAQKKGRNGTNEKCDTR